MENLKVMQWVSNAVLVAVVVLAVAVLSGCSTTYSRTPIMSDDGGETAVAYATAIKFGLGNKESTSLGKYKLSADGGLDMEGYGNQQDSSVAFVEGLKLGAVYAGQRGIVIGQSAETASVQSADVGTVNSVVGEGSSAPSVRTPSTVSASGITIAVVGNKATCGLCKSFWNGVNAAEVSSALCGAKIIDADATAAPEDYAAFRPSGSFSYPLVRVYEDGAFKGEFVARNINQAGLIGKVKGLAPSCVAN